MTSAIEWLRTTTPGLLVLCGLAVAILLFTIIRVKLEPFGALLLAGLGLALAAGLPVKDIVGTAIKSGDSVLETGFGGILGHIALIIGLGTVLGAILERSGGADALTTMLMRAFGEKRAPIAMGLLGLIVGIPVFFDIGIFVLAPLVYITALRGRKSLVLYAMPMLAGLSMTHAFLPPHPGPVAAAGLLGVDLGWIIIMGLACGIPAWLVAGVWWGSFIGKRVIIDVPDEFVSGELAEDEEAHEHPPTLGTILFVILVPMVLILFGTFGNIALDPGFWQSAALFVGTPAVALTIAVLIAMWLLGYRRGMKAGELASVTAASLKPVGMILLVVGAGAFFGAVLRATGVGTALAGSMEDIGRPIILCAYLISVALRLAQGSATVAIVTTAGIIEPI